jgi:hypothetical protein
VQLAGIEMVWLIGAIVTYGIVVLLIGIAVVVYLLGGEAADFAARPDRSAIRRLPHEPNPFARQHQSEGSGVRELAYR